MGVQYITQKTVEPANGGKTRAASTDRMATPTDVKTKSSTPETKTPPMLRARGVSSFESTTASGIEGLERFAESRGATCYISANRDRTHNKLHRVVVQTEAGMDPAQTIATFFFGGLTFSTITLLLWSAAFACIKMITHASRWAQRRGGQAQLEAESMEQGSYEGSELNGARLHRPTSRGSWLSSVREVSPKISYVAGLLTHSPSTGSAGSFTTTAEQNSTTSAASMSGTPAERPVEEKQFTLSHLQLVAPIVTGSNPVLLPSIWQKRNGWVQPISRMKPVPNAFPDAACQGSVADNEPLPGAYASTLRNSSSSSSPF